MDSKTHARSFEELKKLFAQSNDIWEKVQLSTERYIAKRKEREPEYSWRSLPSKTKYLSMIARYWKDFVYLPLVNPAMDGLWGFLFLSKDETYKHLPSEFLPKSIKFTNREDKDGILKKMKESNIHFPCIAKPDFWEQSFWVAYITNETELEAYLETALPECLLQEYINKKKEYWIYCLKKWDTFTVSSCVEKVKPYIEGNGSDSIENLVQWLSISEDIKHRILQSIPVNERFQVPQTGKHINIVKSGSSYFGIIMEKRKIDKKIEEEMNEILTNYKGFYAGRFDILADSLEDIVAKKYKIVELNGSSWIPLHIYNPSNTVQENHDIMNQHFQDLFDIAKNNEEKYPWKKMSLPATANYIFKRVWEQKLPWSASKFRKVSFAIIRTYIKLEFSTLFA